MGYVKHIDYLVRIIQLGTIEMFVLKLFIYSVSDNEENVSKTDQPFIRRLDFYLGLKVKKSNQAINHVGIFREKNI